MLSERHTNSGAHVAIVLYVNVDLCVFARGMRPHTVVFNAPLRPQCNVANVLYLAVYCVCVCVCLKAVLLAMLSCSLLIMSYYKYRKWKSQG